MREDETDCFDKGGRTVDLFGLMNHYIIQILQEGKGPWITLDALIASLF